MKYIYIIFLIAFSCSPNANKKECHLVYRLGNNFIQLSINENGNGTAIIGESNDLDNDLIRIDTIIESTKFFLKTSDVFFKKLEAINIKRVEGGTGYSRMQIFLNDSLYYDTRTYGPEFWELYSIISADIPTEYNPFKTKRF